MNSVVENREVHNKRLRESTRRLRQQTAYAYDKKYRKEHPEVHQNWLKRNPDYKKKANEKRIKFKGHRRMDFIIKLQ